MNKKEYNVGVKVGDAKRDLKLGVYVISIHENKTVQVSTRFALRVYLFIYMYMYLR